MTDLERLVQRFSEATACDAVVWARDDDQGPLRVEAGYASIAPPTVVDLLPPGGPPARVQTEQGALYVAAVAGPHRMWVGVGPCGAPDADGARYVEFLSMLVGDLHRARLEVEHAAFSSPTL